MVAITIEATGKDAKIQQGIGCFLQFLGAVVFVATWNLPIAGMLFLIGFIIMFIGYSSAWWNNG